MPATQYDESPLPPERRRLLEAQLRHIDKVCPSGPFRRIFRALLRRNYGDEAGLDVELACVASEGADYLSLRASEVDRLTMPAEVYLCRRRPVHN